MSGQSINADAAREFATKVTARLQQAGFTALWAGGCVRDLLRDRIPKDFDVATDATPQAVRDLFGKRRTLAVGESFGVIIVQGSRESGPVEVATFRKEGPYLDGRRPSEVVYCTPEEDAHRRDFTINGMFLDPIGNELLDYVGGQRDLESGIIRAIGTPADRMTEDKLRMLRAVRFTSVMGFDLESRTEAAVCAMADQISVVSAERIAEELRKMLLDRNRAQAVALLQQTGLLKEILPEVAGNADALDDIRSVLGALIAPTFAQVMSVLLRDHADKVGAICRRLKLSNDDRVRAAWLAENRGRVAGLMQRDDATRKRLAIEPGFPELLATAEAESRVDLNSAEDVEAVRDYVTRTPAGVLNPPALVDGQDLIQSGLRPGPAFRQILESIRDAQLNGEINTPEEAIALAMTIDAG